MMYYRGLGDNNPATAIDTTIQAGAALVPAFALAAPPPGTTNTNQSYQSYCDNASAFNPFNWFYCLPADVQNEYINATGGPGKSIISGGPNGPISPTAPSLSVVPAGTPGAVLAGQDSSGNNVYMLGSTPQQDQASTLAALTAAAANLDASNNPPVDCTQWYNAFNSQCAGSNQWLVLGAAAVGVLFLLELVRR